MPGVKGRSGAPGKPKGAPRTDTRQVTFDEPVPCCIRKPTDADPYALCGKPAQHGSAWSPGWAYLADSYPGVWIVQPICRECIEAMQKIYEK